MISFKYAGKAFELNRVLQDKSGGFESGLVKCLQSIGLEGTFTITPQRSVNGSPHTKGKLRFTGSQSHGVVASYHPTNQDNSINIQFIISSPQGMLSEVFLDRFFR
jgi:hypothetical protein